MTGNCDNCKNTTAQVEAYGLSLCTDCEQKISSQLDGIRDTQRINNQMYGNDAGTIDRIEYLHGDQHYGGWYTLGK